MRNSEIEKEKVCMVYWFTLLNQLRQQAFSPPSHFFFLDSFLLEGGKAPDLALYIRLLTQSLSCFFSFPFPCCPFITDLSLFFFFFVSPP